MTLSIIPIPALKDNYIWAIHQPDNHSILIVDPGEAKPVDDFLKQHQFKLQGILITHHHWDHTNGITALKKLYDVPVFAPTIEKVASATNLVNDKDTIEVDHFPAFQAIAIPGHTLGHTAYYGHESLFCGDTLFAAGCGRLFEGTPQQMFTSLQKLASLPGKTNIYCGHEYTLNNLRFAKTVEPGNKKIDERIARITEKRNKGLPSLPVPMEDEKATNPFLRCDSAEIIKNVEAHAGKPLKNPVEVFTELRKWKDSF